MFENMNGSSFLILVLVINLLFAFVIARVAQKKGRSWAAFWWLTILAGPIIMGIVVAAISPINSSVAAPTQPIVPNTVAGQIEKLAALKEQGHLTEEEFAAEKRKLLNS